MGGCIRMGLFCTRQRLHTTSSSPKRSASSGPAGIFPLEWTPSVAKAVGAGVGTVGLTVYNFGPSLTDQNKRLEKLETRINDIDSTNQTQHKNIEVEVSEIKKDIAVLKEQSSATCENVKYIRKSLDRQRRWFS